MKYFFGSIDTQISNRNLRKTKVSRQQRLPAAQGGRDSHADTDGRGYTLSHVLAAIWEGDHKG